MKLVLLILLLSPLLTTDTWFIDLDMVTTTPTQQTDNSDNNVEWENDGQEE